MEKRKSISPLARRGRERKGVQEMKAVLVEIVEKVYFRDCGLVMFCFLLLLVILVYFYTDVMVVEIMINVLEFILVKILVYLFIIYRLIDLLIW